MAKYLEFCKSSGHAIAEMQIANSFIAEGMQIYDFDQDFASTLDDANWASLLPDIMKKTPYTAFYLNLPGTPATEGIVILLGVLEPDLISHPESD